MRDGKIFLSAWESDPEYLGEKGSLGTGKAC